MSDKTIITPYYFSKSVPSLASLPFSNAEINDQAKISENEAEAFTPLYERLAGFVADTLQQGDRPVSIAADCSTTIAVMAGLQRASVDPSIIWLDAHGDFNTRETSPSGFLGGMPLAMITGLGDMALCEIVDLKPVNDKNIILTDGRDLDPGEAVLVENSDLLHLPDMTELLTMELPEGPLYVHFDTDVLNLEEMYAVNYPAKGGPSTALVTEVFTRLAKTGRVVAASMSTREPTLDNNHECEEMCLGAFKVLLN